MACSYGPFDKQAILSADQLQNLNLLSFYDSQDGLNLSTYDSPVEFVPFFDVEKPERYDALLAIVNRGIDQHDSSLFLFSTNDTLPAGFSPEVSLSSYPYSNSAGGNDLLYRRDRLFFSVGSGDFYWIDDPATEGQLLALNGAVTMNRSINIFQGQSYTVPVFNLSAIRPVVTQHDDGQGGFTETKQLVSDANADLGGDYFLFNESGRIGPFASAIKVAMKSAFEADATRFFPVPPPPAYTFHVNFFEGFSGAEAEFSEGDVIADIGHIRFIGGDLEHGATRAAMKARFLVAMEIRLLSINAAVAVPVWESTSYEEGVFYYEVECGFSASGLGFDLSAVSLSFIGQGDHPVLGAYGLEFQNSLYYNSNGSSASISFKDRVTGDNKTLLIQGIGSNNTVVVENSKYAGGFVVDIFSDDSRMIRLMDGYGNISYLITDADLNEVSKEFRAGAIRYYGFYPQADQDDYLYFSYINLQEGDQKADQNFSTFVYGLYNQKLSIFKTIGQ